MAIYSGGTLVIDATNVQSPRLTGNLPAINGASLTNLSAGKILQVQQGTNIADSQHAGSSEATVTSVAITPAASSSKILVLWNLNCSADAYAKGFVYRGSTKIAQGESDGNRTPSSHAYYSNYQADYVDQFGGCYLDSPSTTSATTYSLRVHAIGDGGFNQYVNRSRNNTNSDRGERTMCSIVLMEVGA